MLLLDCPPNEWKCEGETMLRIFYAALGDCICEPSEGRVPSGCGIYFLFSILQINLFD